MKRSLGIVALCAAGALPVTAGAADELFDREVGVYGGLGVGYATIETEEFVDDVLGEIDNLEDDRVAYQAFLGGRFIPWLGAEVSYIDFGEADDDAGVFDSSGVTAALTGHLPATPSITVSARYGYMWWDAEGTGITPVDEFDFDADGEDPFYGVGVSFGDSEGLGLGLRYDWYEMDNTDIEVPSLNLEFGF